MHYTGAWSSLCAVHFEMYNLPPSVTDLVLFMHFERLIIEKRMSILCFFHLTFLIASDCISINFPLKINVSAVTSMHSCKLLSPTTTNSKINQIYPLKESDLFYFCSLTSLPSLLGWLWHVLNHTSQCGKDGREINQLCGEHTSNSNY